MEELDPKLARKEAVNDAKRALIMDAALKVIGRDGYANVRLEDIGEEAGFSKASIYHYFPDKEALIMHIIIREQRATYDKCVEVVGRGLPFLDTVREFAMAICDRFFGSGRFFEQYIGGAPSLSMVSGFMSGFASSITKHEELLRTSITWKSEISGLLLRVITEARKDGILTIPVEDGVVCCFMLSFFQTFIMQSLESLQCNEQEWGANAKINVSGAYNKALDSLFILLGPWIKDGSSNRRWYDVQ